jgi:multidrug efflux pump subunit AcrB
MPDSLKRHVHAVLMALAVIAGICGSIAVWAAVTLAHYLAAAAIWAVAVAFVFAARLVDAEQTARDFESLAKHNSRTSAKESTHGDPSKSAI